MLMVYETLLIVGALGMLAQAALGLGHGFGGAHGHGGHAGHGHGHSQAQHGGRGERANGPSPLWALLSPLAIFSLCVGAGATGLLTRAILHGFWSGLAATAGALLF